MSLRIMHSCYGPIFINAETKSRSTSEKMLLEELGRALIKAHSEQRECVPRDPPSAVFVNEVTFLPTTLTKNRRTISPGTSPDSKRKRSQVCLAVRTERQTHFASLARNIFQERREIHKCILPRVSVQLPLPMPNRNSRRQNS